MPVPEPATPPHRWALSDTGRAAARRLGPLLPSDALLVASDEPKAVQTLVAARPSAPVVRDARFAEVRRDEPYHGDYRARRLAYLRGDSDPRWEPPDAVVARFDAGVTEHLRSAAGRSLVVATHGMAMTLWLAARGMLPDPAAFWSALGLPDAYAVDVAAGTVSRLGPPAGFRPGRL